MEKQTPRLQERPPQKTIAQHVEESVVTTAALCVARETPHICRLPVCLVCSGSLTALPFPWHNVCDKKNPNNK